MKPKWLFLLLGLLGAGAFSPPAYAINIIVCRLIVSQQLRRLPSEQRLAVIAATEVRTAIANNGNYTRWGDEPIPSTFNPVLKDWIRTTQTAIVPGENLVDDFIAYFERSEPHMSRQVITSARAKRRNGFPPQLLFEMKLSGGWSGWTAFSNQMDALLTERSGRAVTALQAHMKSKTLTHEILMTAIFWAAARSSDLGWLDLVFSPFNPVTKRLDLPERITSEFVTNIIEMRLKTFTQYSGAYLPLPTNKDLTRHEMNALSGMHIGYLDTGGRRGYADEQWMSGLQKTEHDKSHAKGSNFSSKDLLGSETSDYLSFIGSYYSLYDRTAGAVREAIVDIPFYIFHEQNNRYEPSFGFIGFAEKLFEERAPGSKYGPTFDEYLLMRYRPGDFDLPEGVTVTSEDISTASELIYKEAGLVDGRPQPPTTWRMIREILMPW